jgi:hypothetical protein
VVKLFEAHLAEHLQSFFAVSIELLDALPKIQVPREVAHNQDERHIDKGFNVVLVASLLVQKTPMGGIHQVSHVRHKFSVSLRQLELCENTEVNHCELVL